MDIVTDNESKQCYKDPSASSAVSLRSNSEARLHLQGFEKYAHHAMKTIKGISASPLMNHKKGGTYANIFFGLKCNKRYSVSQKS